MLILRSIQDLCMSSSNPRSLFEEVGMGIVPLATIDIEEIEGRFWYPRGELQKRELG